MKVKHYIFCILILGLIVSCSSSADRGSSVNTFNYDYEPSDSELLSTNIPVISIQVDNNEEVNEKEYKWTCTLNVTDDLVPDNNKSISNIKIKCRGNSSFKHPKKSYTLKLASKEKILGLDKNKNWVLIANYADNTLLRNLYTTKTGKEIFDNLAWSPSFKSVHLKVNGIYRGVYLFGESVKINDKRVNIQDISDFGTSDYSDVNNDGKVDLYDGGFIVEINKRLDEKFNFISERGVRFSLKEPDEVSSDIENHIQKIVQKAEDVLFSSNFADPENGYSKYFDVDSMIDWFIINEFSKNTDSAFFSSIYMYYNPIDGKIYLGPIWDFDLGYGNCGDYPKGEVTNNPNGFYIALNASWYIRLLTDENFVSKLKTRWFEIRTDMLSSINNLDTLGNNLSEAAVCNFTKWFLYGSEDLTSETLKTEYLDTVDNLKTWMLTRYNFMDSEISAL